MNNQYLMPANSKKSRLILGFFTPTDLVVWRYSYCNNVSNT